MSAEDVFGDPASMSHNPLRSRFAVVLLAASLFAVGCATLNRPAVPLTRAQVADSAALDQAVEAFYRAKDASQLRAAVEAAKALAPDSGRYHEIAAELARFELRDSDEVAHLIAAAQDQGYQQTALTLARLDGASRTDEEQARYLALLQSLAASHPDPRVQAEAAWLAAEQLHVAGDDRGRDEAVKRISGVLPLSVVGGWDNDQGKGFDSPYPPESGVDLTAKYQGALMELAWSAPPRGFRGQTRLQDYLAPDQWSVAYAASGFRAAKDGRYELRLASGDPVKVFVDGTVVFEAREVDGSSLFDQFVIPVQLKAGDHQVLIKSAHRTGDWQLFARVTGEGGEKAAVEPLAAGAIAHALPAPKLLSDDAVLTRAVASLPRGSARLARFVALNAALRYGGSLSARVTQEVVRLFPDSITLRYALIAALWNNAERGRTADELTLLDGAVGKDLALVRKQQARFWMQEGLRQRARTSLLELVKQYPERPAIARQLAELYGQEKWNEDECRTLEEIDSRRPHTLALQMDLADCWTGERREDRSIALYRQILQVRPRQPMVLGRLHSQLLERGRFDQALEVAQAWARAYPETLFPRLSLAETLRRAGQSEKAMGVLQTAQADFPNSAEVLRAEASLAWRQGDEKAAIADWQAALVRAPDDSATANRLDFVAPAAMGPWAADVPTSEELEAAVRAGPRFQQKPGADLAYLLDHEVTELRPDGSTINVVTHVVHAFDQAGRDKLTRRRLQYGGRIRVLQAWSVDARGRRSEASVRSREVLYRGLDVGSTIVLQYRADSPPSGFLPRYLSKSWSFQSLNDQRGRAQFVLWYPAGSALHEVKTGPLQREEKKVGDEVRVAWTMEGTDPVVAEPHMPGLIEVAANLQLTTIPGWDAYKKWEDALLEGALRGSPELDAVAEKLAEGARTPEEKLSRIHQFVMEEIRYQQDYESFIAGVKPHPASMVLERRYGDCKDKTVLFMTLARKLGLKADFATVRTRSMGPVMKGLPTQQFNHAIVYIPAQEGFPEARFYDSTADALDLGVLRDDDAGTLSLVYDPDTRQHTWIPIPWQSPDHHVVQTSMKVALNPDGSASGDLQLSAKGRVGSVFRQLARNPETFKQFLQRVSGAYFAGASTEGAEAVETKRLDTPAVVRARFSAPNVARAEGNELRMRLPTDWSPREIFSLATRRHDLVLGTPNQQKWEFEIALPAGMRISRLPTSGEVKTDCLSLQRTVVPTAKGIGVRQSLEIRCERISAEQYPAYRTRVEQMVRLLDEELVVTKSKGPVLKPASAVRPAGRAQSGVR